MDSNCPSKAERKLKDFECLGIECVVFVDNSAADRDLRIRHMVERHHNCQNITDFIIDYELTDRVTRSVYEI
jgi:hypothetical protein